MSGYSIKDIAQLAGVSIATVSRVINNKGKYSEKTKNKVMQVVKETGYQIDTSAQMMRTNKSYTIGILVPEIVNPFFACLVQRMEEVLFDMQYTTIICNTGRNSEQEMSYLRVLRQKRADGVIVISGAVNGFAIDNALEPIPYVCVDREPKDINSTIFIASNHYQAALNVGDYLFDHGAKHPTFVFDENGTSATQSRRNGFKTSLEQHQVSFKQFKRSRYSTDKDEVKAFLDANPEVDAFFASNDILAVRLLRSLKQLGYKIPEDYQIIGFDNLMFDSWVTPALTSVSQDIDKLAETTVTALLNIIKGEGILGSKLLLPTKLAVRDSTR